jgi:hypothetical protein
MDQRADRASPRIAAECDASASDRAETASQREDIDESLGGMLIPASPALITGVCDFDAMRTAAPSS